MWGSQPQKYEFPWFAASVSASKMPVGLNFSPEDAPGLSSGVYLISNSTELISTDFIGPFVSLGITASGGPAASLTLLFLGTSSKLKAAAIEVMMLNPATVLVALATFKAVVVVVGTQVSIPDTSIDGTHGVMTSRRVY